MTRKTKRVLWTATAAVALTGAGVLLWFRSGPEASAYTNLAVPRITHLDDQRMLVVEAVGDPNLVAARAFELLFSAYTRRMACRECDRLRLRVPAGPGRPTPREPNGLADTDCLLEKPSRLLRPCPRPPG